jgi:protein-S-isoprenylcysteine O-methyltransferase Ste14
MAGIDLAQKAACVLRIFRDYQAGEGLGICHAKLLRLWRAKFGHDAAPLRSKNEIEVSGLMPLLALALGDAMRCGSPSAVTTIPQKKFCRRGQSVAHLHSRRRPHGTVCSTMTVDDPRKFPFPPLILIVGLLASWGLQHVWPLPVVWPHWFLWVGLFLFLAPHALAVWAHLTFRRHHTVVNPRGDVSAIVTEGPFRYTRNPMYLTLLIAYVGGALLFELPWAWLLLPVVFLALHFGVILPEERYLTAKFGPTYASYKNRVNRWL